jgi:flagellar protein FliS
MSYASPQAYREAAVLTASPEQLVVMLYDGAIRFLRQGEMAMREGAIAHTNDRLQRAEAILDELQATLNPEAGEIAERLEGIYVFCRRLLIEARIERDPAKVGRTAALLAELRGAWAQIGGQA